MSDNVFADIGLPDPEIHLAKAAIVFQIAGIVEQRGLTQAQVGEVFNISQGKVSSLLRGQLSGYSVDRLLRFLNLLNADVTILIEPHGRGKTSVAQTAA